MVFYTLQFSSVPKIRFACSAVIAPGERHNIIDRRENFVELCFHTCTANIIETDGETFSVSRDTPFVIMPDARYHSHVTADADTTSVIISAAAEIDDLCVTRHVIDDAEELEGFLSAQATEILCIPRVALTDEDEFQEISALLHSIIDNFAAGTTAHMLRCVGDWFRILSILDSSFRREIERQVHGTVFAETGSARYYVRRAQKYIAVHYRDVLTLTEIASYLDITPGYLCAVFKSGTGQTVIEYINQLRIREVRAHISEGDPRLFPAICHAVGLRDIRYAQRLFKKHFGVSMQRYRQLESGISLYHKNPYAVDTIDHDIYKDEAP